MKNNLLKQFVSALVVLAFIGLAFGSGDDLTDSSDSSDASSSSYSSSPDGIYTYSRGDVELSITVYGDTWTGISKMCQFCDTEYDNGYVRGTDIYDESGIVQLGYISGNSLTTSYGGNRITLYK